MHLKVPLLFNWKDNIVYGGKGFFFFFFFFIYMKAAEQPLVGQIYFCWCITAEVPQVEVALE